MNARPAGGSMVERGERRRVQPESPIGLLANLQCAGGHRWYSPQPYAYEGRECLAGLTAGRRQRLCRLPLERRSPVT